MFKSFSPYVFYVISASFPAILFAQGTASDFQAEIEAWRSANNFCRGVSDPEVYIPACELREKIGRRLENAGYCGGEGGWALCYSDDQTTQLRQELTTAGGLSTVCAYGDREEVGAAEAKTYCIGSLQGVAKIMQYNCTSRQGGFQPLDLFVMGEFSTNAELVSTFTKYLRSDPSENSAPWAIAAASAFSAKFPCSN